MFCRYGVLRCYSQFNVLKFTREKWTNPRSLSEARNELDKWRRKLAAANLVANAPKEVQPYLRLMRADKPIGTWLLFWPGAWSIALAATPGTLPSISCLALFGMGSVLMRGAGCVVNDLWDADFDKRVARTKVRPLASGELNRTQAVGCLIALLSPSLSILMQFNWLTVGIGCSSLLLVGSYPLFKRFTYWPQAMLGLTFNYGAIMGYTAASGTFNPSIILPLYAASICWTIVYDTIYAHQDKQDDLMIGVRSTALRFGDQTKYWLSGFSAAMLANLWLVGVAADQTLPYNIGLCAVAAHLYWQIQTVNISNGKDCWNKFIANRWIGPILFTAIVMSNLIR